MTSAAAAAGAGAGLGVDLSAVAPSVHLARSTERRIFTPPYDAAEQKKLLTERYSDSAVRSVAGWLTARCAKLEPEDILKLLYATNATNRNLPLRLPTPEDIFMQIECQSPAEFVRNPHRPDDVVADGVETLHCALELVFTSIPVYTSVRHPAEWLTETQPPALVRTIFRDPDVALALLDVIWPIGPVVDADAFVVPHRTQTLLSFVLRELWRSEGAVLDGLERRADSAAKVDAFWSVLKTLCTTMDVRALNAPTTCASDDAKSFPFGGTEVLKPIGDAPDSEWPGPEAGAFELCVALATAPCDTARMERVGRRAQGLVLFLCQTRVRFGDDGDVWADHRTKAPYRYPDDVLVVADAQVCMALPTWPKHMLGHSAAPADTAMPGGPFGPLLRALSDAVSASVVDAADGRPACDMAGLTQLHEQIAALAQQHATQLRSALGQTLGDVDGASGLPVPELHALIVTFLY